MSGNLWEGDAQHDGNEKQKARKFEGENQPKMINPGIQFHSISFPRYDFTCKPCYLRSLPQQQNQTH